jgi:hypothetical protein
MDKGSVESYEPGRHHPSGHSLSYFVLSLRRVLSPTLAGYLSASYFEGPVRLRR